jgi:hypothetical protein
MFWTMAFLSYNGLGEISQYAGATNIVEVIDYRGLKQLHGIARIPIQVSLVEVSAFDMAGNAGEDHIA